MPDQKPLPLILVVAVGLVLALLACLGLAGWLAATDHDVPDFLVATGSASVGALAALLVKPDGSSG